MALAKWFELMQKYPELKLTREEIEALTEEGVEKLWRYKKWRDSFEKNHPGMKERRELAERIEPSLDRVLEILTGIKITYKYIKREK